MIKSNLIPSSTIIYCLKFCQMFSIFKKGIMLQNVSSTFIDDSGILTSANSVSPEPVSIEEQFRNQLLSSLDKSSFFMNEDGHDNVSFFFFKDFNGFDIPFFELAALTNFSIFMCHFEAFI